MISLGDGPFKPIQCRDIILAELRRAGVTNIITEEKEVQVLDEGCPAAQTPPGIIIPSLAKSFHTETHFKVGAKLYDWKLYRAWTYWIVSCEKLVDEIHPKDAAILFDQHGNKMRVDGHCGCPRPEGHYLRRHNRIDMKRVEGGCDLFLDKKHHVFVPNTKVKEEHWITVFEKLDEENPGPIGGIPAYHVDTQEAFDAFCRYLAVRGAEREKAEKAFRDEQVKTENWDLKFEPQLDGFILKKEESCQKGTA